MIELNEENKRLFGDQVNDHIEKLSDLLAMPAGTAIEESMIRKACLATRLLEGSARMLGLDAWSATLEMFRGLIEGAAGGGRDWDEQLSQIVSEIVEAEEQVVAEILAGEIDSVDCPAAFDGIRRETEILLGEAPASDGGETSIRFTPVPVDEGETAGSATDRFVTIDRLMDCLGAVRDNFREHLENPHGDDTVRNLELAFGESEFFLGLAGEIIRRLGNRDRPFVAKVSSTTVLDGVQDFIRLHGRLRGWKAALETRSDYFSIEREYASDLAVLLESCVYDSFSMVEDRNGVELAAVVEITREGSFLSCKVRDNGPDRLCDSEIDSCDALAFYPGLRKVRGLIERRGGLLWVEPDRGRTARFKFTFPYAGGTADFVVVTAGGREIAVPCRSIETFLRLDPEGMERQNGRTYVSFAGSRIPIFGMDELSDGELPVGGGEDHVMVFGLAEKRVGIPVRGQGSRVEAVRDQLTDEDWVSLTRRFLHIGEAEHPVLDPVSVFRRVDCLEETADAIDGSASIAGGGDVERAVEEVSVPRAFG